MLAGMSNVLRMKCEKMVTAYEIMECLQAMFGQPSYQSDHDAFKAAMNAGMKAIISVQGHQVEILGVVINELRKNRRRKVNQIY